MIGSFAVSVLMLGSLTGPHGARAPALPNLESPSDLIHTRCQPGGPERTSPLQPFQRFSSFPLGKEVGHTAPCILPRLWPK
jgi:hypothetical protein